MESTCLDLLKEANEEYDTEMSLLVNEIMGNDKSKAVTTDTSPVVIVSTGNVENADIIEDRINKKRKPQYQKSISKRRKKMGW